MTLAAIVVFTTTYMLILPAFTLDSQSAAEQGGIDVPAVETTAEDTSDSTEASVVDENAAANDANANADQAEASGETKADQSAEKADAKAKEPDESAAKVKAADPEKSDVKLLTGKKTITATQGKGDDFAVSAVVSTDAKVPADVTITATELGKNTDGFDFDQYKDDALAALKKDSSDVKSIKSIKFYDISLESDSQDKSVEPSAPVSVKISYDDGMKVSDADNIRIVHFAEQKNGTEKAQVLDAKENKVKATTTADGSKLTEASFETDGFSIYAVVDTGDTGDEARMTLEFYNGSTLIDSMYVKNSDVLLGDGERDDSKQYIEDIIYDPGVGTIPTGKIFKGWIMNKADYTVEDADNALTIADIRQWAAEHPITENETVKFYALVYTSIKVDYRDEDDISLGTDNILLPASETSSTYTIQHAYTPKDDLHNFEGWNVKEGSSNIPGYTEGTIYENGTNVTITGDVTFSVNAPEGHWLVFHEDGGTYIAPKFIKSDDVTERPSVTMQKLGYTFDDWYADEACTTKFNFGTTIGDRTHVYAKWNARANAPYTVVIWKQNLDGTDYDFEEAITLTGPSNTTVNTVTQQGSGNNAYARINGQNKIYEGFHLKEFDQNKTITPEGTTVVNVYYDRTEYTLRFFYARSYDVTRGGTTEYYRENIGNASNGTIQGVSGSSNAIYYTNQNGNSRVYWVDGAFRTSQNYNNWNPRYYSGQVWERKERQTGGTTQTYVQVNCNNEGFLQGISRGRSLEQSLTYRGNNDYENLGGSNTWKDVNNSNINGDATKLISESYLAKDPENITLGSMQINNVTTNVVTGIGSNTVQSVDMTYYYVDVKVRYEQSLVDLWPVPSSSTFNSPQRMTPYNDFLAANPNHRQYAEGNINPLLQGSWATGNNIGGKYSTMNSELFVNNDSTAYFLTYWRFEPHYEYQYNVYFSALPGETGGVTYKGNRYILQNDKSYVVANGQGWGSGADTDSGNGYWDVGTVTFDGTNKVGRVDESGTINVYYDRIQRKIEYFDGIYVDGDGNEIKNESGTLLNTAGPILYGADTSSYNKGGSNYYTPAAPEGYVFEGWYADSEGLQPYTFSSTMPMKDIKVYAKWRQVQYRVFLHPNAGTDASLDWGSDDQKMNFRVSYGGTISAPQGLRTGYEMVGWFTDEACTAPFDEALELNNTTVTENYDKTTDFTDPMDKWGNGATSNSDVDRAWITKKYNLYAKWRKVIDGAKGIGVVYDANGGSNVPTDTTLYLDTAEATAQNASTPPTGKKFEYWVVQTWDAAQNKYVDTNDKIYPGDTYIVLLDNAKQVIYSWENPNNPTDISQSQDATHTKIHEATYTVQLRAEYVEAEQETPTHIDWFANNGTGAYVSDSKDGKLKINEPVDIRPSNTFSYRGHKFLGWARVEDTEAGAHPDRPDLDKDDLWLIYDEATNTFKVKQEGTTELRTVSQIAADERQPYHDLYAVWEVRTYKVTIKKVVGGDNPDTDKAFTINYDFDNTSLTDGSVALKHNQSTILDIDVPYGTIITPSENEPSYEKTYEAVRTTRDDGTELDDPVTVQAETGGGFKVEGDTTITVTNTKKVVDITIKKVDENGGLLQGAKFEMYSLEGSSPTKVDFIPDGVVDMSTKSSMEIEGVPSGRYRLTEIKAPDGYVLLEKNVDFTVDASGTTVITVDSDSSSIGKVTGTKKDTLEITNTPGTPLPHTGGIGTTIIYILGSLLVVGCGVVLVSRKRMGSDK